MGNARSRSAQPRRLGYILTWVWCAVLLGGLIVTGPQAVASDAQVLEKLEQLRTSARSALREKDLTVAYELAVQAAKIGADALGILDPGNLESYLLVSEAAGQLGQTAVSIEYAENAFSVLEANETLSTGRSAGDVLRALGIAYGRSGDYETAEEMLMAAQVNHEEKLGSAAPEVASDLVALVELYLRADNPLALKEVPGLLKRARTIREMHFEQLSPELAEIWMLFGEAIVASIADVPKEDRRALEAAANAGELALNNAERILAEHFHRSHAALVRIDRAKGDLAVRLGRLDEAFDAYALALEAGGEHPSAADALRFATLAAARDDPALTLAACKAANTISYAEFEEFSRWANLPSELKYRGRIGVAQRLCLSLIYGLAISPNEKAHALVEIVLRWRSAAVRAERALLGRLRNEGDLVSLQDTAALNQARSRLSVALIKQVRTRADDLTDIESALNDVGHYEEIITLNTMHRDSYDDGGIVTASDAASALSAHEIMLFFIKLDIEDVQAHLSLRRHFWRNEHYAALLLEPSGDASLIDLGAVGTLDAGINDALKRFRSADPLDPAPQLAVMTELYDLVWKPIAQTVKKFEVVHVFTEGVLSFVPLVALADERGRFVGEDTQLMYHSSPRDIVAAGDQRRPAERDGLIIAAPDFGDVRDSLVGPGNALAFRELAGSRAEQTAIADILGSDVVALTGPRATEAELQQLTKSRFVHFATHGFFLNEAAGSHLNEVNSQLIEKSFDPINREIDMVRSGLALAGANTGVSDAPGYDGVLTALKIVGLDFSATELVTLSACETGLGTSVNDEGVFGLRLAFELAGARNLIMSLWVVHGRELRQQMTMLYKLIEGGDAPAAALHKVQKARIRWYREHMGKAPPAQWAAFVAQAHGPIAHGDKGPQTINRE